MSPRRSWKPCADRTPCSPSTRAANSPLPPSSAPSSSHRLRAAGTSPSWISLGPWNQDLIKSTWKTSESLQARPPPASCTRSSVTGIFGSAGSALRLSHRGSCYRCTCAHRTPTGNPTSRCSPAVFASETHCLPSCRLLQSHLGENSVIRGLHSGRSESNVGPLFGFIV